MANQHGQRAAVHDRPRCRPCRRQCGSYRRSRLPSLAASSLSATSPEPTALRPHDSPRRDHQGAPDEADVVVPEGTTVFDDDIRPWPTSTGNCWRALRGPHLMLLATGSSSTSTVAGVPGSTRNNCSVRPSRSTARKKQPDGSSPRQFRLRNGERGRPQVPDTAWLSRHGAAHWLCQIYATNPGTASYASMPSITAARLRADPTAIQRRCGRSFSFAYIRVAHPRRPIRQAMRLRDA